MALIALLAVGPFLHAHLGASSVTGLHVAGIQAVAVADPTQTVWTQHNEAESAAIGVETSYSRQVSFGVEDPPQGFVLMTLCLLLMASPAWACGRFTRRPHRAVRAFFQPGFPPLMHAPPA